MYYSSQVLFDSLRMSLVMMLLLPVYCPFTRILVQSTCKYSKSIQTLPSILYPLYCISNLSEKNMQLTGIQNYIKALFKQKLYSFHFNCLIKRCFDPGDIFLML